MSENSFELAELIDLHKLYVTELDQEGRPMEDIRRIDSAIENFLVWASGQ